MSNHMFRAKMEKKERNTGVDILRILLALMVISVHFNASETGHVSSSLTWWPMKFLVYGVDALVIPAVNTYVIVSGFFSYFFMRSYQRIVNSLVKLWMCLLFYSVVGAVVISCIYPGTVSGAELITRFFPIATGEWWYMSVYFATMLISPFLNSFVKSSSKKVTIAVLSSFLIVCSIIPFFTKFNEPLGVNYGYSLIWFIVLYITGAMLCKYYSDYKKRHLLIWYVALGIINIAVANLASKVAFLQGYGLSVYNSITLYLQAIFLFIWFKNIQISSNREKKIITYISGLSLAAYIFHCQTDIGRVIWREINPAQWADSLVLIPVFVILVLSVFIVAISIEFLRRKLFSINDFENRMAKSITVFVESSFNRFFKLIDKA